MEDEILAIQRLFHEFPDSEQELVEQVLENPLNTSTCFPFEIRVIIWNQCLPRYTCSLAKT